ncbi:MAG: helix-turn-helix domain-containing protein [Bacteroidota bacterium]
MFDSKLLFFFSALGVFNVLLLALYCFTKAKTVSIYLGLLLIAIAIRVGVSCFYFFDKGLSPIIIQLGLMANLASGLFLFAFISSNNGKILRWQMNLLIASLWVLFLFGLLYPFSSHFRTWDFYVRYTFHGILTLLVLTSYLKFRSLDRMNDTLIRLKYFVLGSFTLVCLSFVVSLYTNYVLGPLLFSLIFYGAVFLILKKKQLIKTVVRKKYANRKIQEALAPDMLEQLNSFLIDTGLFKNPNLKVRDLATELNIPEHQLSQLLNDNLKLGFSNYINNYRVEEAKKMLLVNNKITIEAIGYEAGFNSKASFFTTFKARTGTTPNQFRKQKLVQD